MSDRHRHRRRRRNQPGAPPGTLHVNAAEGEAVVRALRYDADGVREDRVIGLDAIPALCGGEGVLWVSVRGLGDERVLNALANTFGLHRLTVEDIVNTHQRPKVEQFTGYTFIVARTPSAADAALLSQLSVILADGVVLTFEERDGADLSPIEQRIRTGAGLICGEGGDYLAYALLDLVIDKYFPLLDSYADRIEAIEAEVLRDSRSNTLARLYSIKEDLRALRRSIWPLRDLVSHLARNEARFTAEARMHLRDCADHVVQLMDLVESDRDTATGLMELHVSNVGNRMNEVMKVLTIIATIFIPLSFITGLYGMNFDPSVSMWNMPELRWRWGYPAALGLMFLVAGGMLLYFRRRGWIGPVERPEPPTTDTDDGAR